MIHMHSTFHVDLMCAPATYRFTDSQAVSPPGQGKGGMGGDVFQFPIRSQALA